ncbi:MAG: hypothetical protein QMD11_07450 [Smithella sp.]|nr:hypothetical protein [Smithella sp.]
MALLLITVFFLFPSVAPAAITVYPTDVIANASRTNFMGFEGMAGLNGLPSTWEEDGIRVEQINGYINNIWSTYNWGQEGSRSWYPSGGDSGYTKISLVSGGEFSNLGLLVGTGWSGTFYVQYALLSDGSTVAQGEIYFPSYPQHLGFAGGGFDTVLLSASQSSGNTVIDGHPNALAIDSIELAESINQPPGTPVLIAPENDATVSGNSVIFSWERATDPEGTDVTYLLQIAENADFTANLSQYAVDENGILIAGLIFPFFALMGWGTMNRRKLTLLIMAALLTSVMIAGCGSDGWGPTIDTDTDTTSVSYNVTGLNSASTYYWRVIAVDEDGTRSIPGETRTFTTN